MSCGDWKPARVGKCRECTTEGAAVDAGGWCADCNRNLHHGHMAAFDGDPARCPVFNPYAKAPQTPREERGPSFQMPHAELVRLALRQSLDAAAWARIRAGCDDPGCQCRRASGTP